MTTQSNLDNRTREVVRQITLETGELIQNLVRRLEIAFDNNLLTTTLYDAAEARVRELFPGDAPEDRWAREYLLDDWPNGTEHWAWVATATEAELRDWIDEIPSAEDRPDLYED